MRAMMLLAALAVALVARAGEDAPKLKVLVISGGHGFNEPAFFKMFDDNPAVTCTKVKHAKASEVYDRDDLLSFDALVLYDFWQKITDEQKQKFLSLFDKGVGLVVLHHALANYQDWPEFEKAAGGKFLMRDEERDGVKIPKSGTGGGKLALHVVSKDHPITKGMDDFEFQDEYYNKCLVSKDVTLLLTTDCPGNQKEVAWCHEVGKSRCVYIMSGHDQKVYNDPNFRTILANAIAWVARK